MGLKKRWWLSFAVVIALLFAADYFVLHFLFPWKKTALLQELRRRVDQETSTEESLETGAGRVMFQQTLRECLNPEASDVSPEALFARLEKNVRKKMPTDLGFEIWELNDGTTVKFLRQENLIQQFSWSLKDKTLACEGFECQCR